MNLVFVSDHAYLPERAGGRESSIHELASLYQQLGHQVVVVAGMRATRLGRWTQGIVRAVRRDTWAPSYRVIRTEDPTLQVQRLARHGAVDALVLNIDRADRLAAFLRLDRIPAHVVYLRDVDNLAPAAVRDMCTDALLVANSSHTARHYSSACGRDVLEVPPLVSVSRYDTRTTNEYVTFINPIPRKGLEVALGVVAALPEVPFLFVEGWPLSRSKRAQLLQRLAPLPNVHFRSWTLDMRGVYSRTRLLLVPSQWEEGFCRVIVEAQASGIAAVASRRGALPTTVGPAGMLVDADAPITTWAAAVEQLWADDALRTRLASDARATAERHHHTSQSRSLGLLGQLEQRVALGRLREAPAGSRNPVSCQPPATPHHVRP